MFTLKSLFKRFLKRKQVRQSPLEEINTMITSIKYHSPDSGSLILMLAVSLVFFYLAQIGYIPFSGQRPSATSVNTPASGIDKNLEAVVFPTKGITVAARWGDAIGKLVDAGVIDQDKFTATMEQDGTALTIEELAILGGDDGIKNRQLVFTAANSRFMVDALWALGLAQESKVLLEGPMKGTDTASLASTGGWTLGKKDAMSYYGKFNLLNLNDADQERVLQITSQIYRPCCGNSTAFPDCNHGMAMLGLVELMISQEASDNQIFEAAKAANAFWFPDSTLELAAYFQTIKNISWQKVSPVTAVSAEYASSQGAQKINQALQEQGTLPQARGGGSCGA
ncbi:MAG TPA: hypothetical protein VI522_04315 [Gammaproteobacteria bacterium]|nr:hypothetical protein [Gammaproteobacteria bacterium]